jgi:hypothetical protein
VPGLRATADDLLDLAGLSKSPLIAPRCVPGVSRRTARSSARRRIVPFYS